MYRRRRRQRFAKARRPSVQHITSTMNNSVLTVTSLTHFFANAGAYQLTGTAATTARESLSNREQENTIGSLVGSTTIDVSIRTITSPGTIEYVVFKRERQSSVPVAGTGLPADATVTASGLQSAYRTEMPGRVVHFGQIGVAENQPRVFKIKIPWSKFKMQTMRQGDWYGITIFNRNTTTCQIDVQTRYKEYR